MPRLFLLILFATLSCASVASAHQIRTAGDLRVLLHADPNDMPYAGTTTTMHVAFSDTSGKFSKDACDCTLFIAPYAERDTMEETGTRIDLATAVHEYGSTYAVTHIFPRRDVYAVRIVGTPRESGIFAPFDLTYDIRVELGNDIAPKKTSRTLFEGAMRYLPYSIFALVVIGILIRKRLSHR